MDFWNLRISLKATVPGRNLWGFLMPPYEETAAVLRAALLASCFLGALAPVFLRAVCLVRAIVFVLCFSFSFITDWRQDRGGLLKGRRGRFGALILRSWF